MTKNIKVSNTISKARRLNKGEAKIVELLETNKSIPQVQDIQQQINRTHEAIPKDNYEILQNLTNKSMELYS